MSGERFRVDCGRCGWIGYRVNAYDCECYDYPCRAPYPGIGCPNGMNLWRVCPRCRNFRVEIVNNAPMARYDTHQLHVRPVWTQEEIRMFMVGRVRQALKRKRGANAD